MWDKPQVLNGLASCLYAVAVLLLLYGGVYLLVHLPVFPIREVRLKGDLKHVTREQIGLIVRRELAGNIFTLDIDRLRDAFEKLPWVRTVSVRRHWPGSVEIDIEEQQPLARWGDTGLVSVQGDVFQAATNAPLPVFEGPPGSVADVMADYDLLVQDLAPLHLKPVRVTLSPRRSLEVALDDGIVLELGRDQTAPRLQRFVRVWPLSIGKMAVPPRRVDMRYPSGFAVQLAVAGAAAHSPSTTVSGKGKH